MILLSKGSDDVVNILLESYDINAIWIYDILKKYIKPEYKVAVVAFGFRDNKVKSINDWVDLYGRENGKLYDGITDSFMAYGVDKNNITFVNYFSDTHSTAVQKIKDADIVYFLGGLPDKMMQRLNEFDLCDILLNYDGIIMGYSAGAVIQLSEYHLSPDEDYKEFSFFRGIPFLNDFYLQVHYENTDTQNETIKRVIKERGKTVYATGFRKGAIIADDEGIQLVGEVYRFE